VCPCLPPAGPAYQPFIPPSPIPHLHLGASNSDSEMKEALAEAGSRNRRPARNLATVRYAPPAPYHTRVRTPRVPPCAPPAALGLHGGRRIPPGRWRLALGGRGGARGAWGGAGGWIDKGPKERADRRTGRTEPVGRKREVWAGG
jgi:hypothetical protein